MRKSFIEFRKTGKFKELLKLRNSLLRNGELASLAYGSFKELLKFKELYHIEEYMGFEVTFSPTSSTKSVENSSEI